MPTGVAGISPPAEGSSSRPGRANSPFRRDTMTLCCMLIQWVMRTPLTALVQSTSSVSAPPHSSCSEDTLLCAPQTTLLTKGTA